MPSCTCGLRGTHAPTCPVNRTRQGNPQQRHQALHPAPQPNAGRLAACPVCKRNNRNPSQAYCTNCTKKLNGRPAPKLDGECNYGRCHDKVAREFLGLPEDYCPLHLQQHQRGLI